MCSFPQECLKKFLQTSAGVQNHEFLLVHHLQRSNYIPALQLNQLMKVSVRVVWGVHVSVRSYSLVLIVLNKNPALFLSISCVGTCILYGSDY